MIMLLWAMSNLFVSTWKECRDLIADFTMQAEVHSAMSRIVDDLRTARSAENSQSGVLIHSNLLGSNTIYTTTKPTYSNDEDAADDDDNTLAARRRPIIYFSTSKSSDKTHPANWRYIYRQRKLGAKSQPLTGNDALSDVNARLYCTEIAPSLWNIRIEAESGVSGHKFTLRTAVFLEGASK